MSEIAPEYNQCVSVTVSEKVAAKEGDSPTDLPPLGDTIDPAILESLPDQATLEFPYYEYRITVHGNGAVMARELPDSGDQSNA